MKKRSLIKSIALLTASVFSLTYFFLIPFARINASHAQNPDVPQPTRTPNVEKRISKVYIPTGASSTFMKTSEGEENLLIQDHITSTRIVESNKGEEQQAYYPYGMTNGEANTISDKQFTSHRSLADTGVYHAGARFYNPQLGVFVSADKVQGPNRYMYGAANPTLYTDPSGKIIPIIIAAIIIGGAAFGAGFGAGYEHGTQVAKYGSVKEPSNIIVAGVAGGAVGAGAGYMGAVAIPAAIGAVSTGVGAASAVGVMGGAQIGVATCLGNPNCVRAVESGAEIASGSNLPPGYSAANYITSPYNPGEAFYDPRQASKAVDELVDSVNEGRSVFGTVLVKGTWQIETDYRIRTSDIAGQDEAIANDIVKRVNSQLAYDLGRADYADGLGSLDALWEGGTGVCRHAASLCTGAAMKIWGEDAAEYFAFNRIPKGVASMGQDATEGFAAHAVAHINTGFFNATLDASNGSRGLVTGISDLESYARNFGQVDGGVRYSFNNRSGSWVQK